MREKGLFDSLFIVIMFLFLIPSVIVPDYSTSVLDAYNNVNSAVLGADNVITKVLADETNKGSLTYEGVTFDTFYCGIKDQNFYDTNIVAQTESFFGNIYSKTGVDCEIKSDFLDENRPVMEVYTTENLPIDHLDHNFDARYYGYMYINCKLKNDFVDISIDKNLHFDKNINASFPSQDITFFIPEDHNYHSDFNYSNGSTVNVYIFSKLQDADIYYTTNGSTPTTSSTPYDDNTVPIAITGNNTSVTLKAASFRDLYNTDSYSITFNFDSSSSISPEPTIRPTEWTYFTNYSCSGTEQIENVEIPDNYHITYEEE